MAIQLVMDGLKMGPCNPGFIDGRDAILAADMINNGGANQCLIWSTFARRGLGEDATQGDPDSWFDGEAGHVVPRKCSDQLLVTKTMSPEVIAGENIEVTLEIGNYKGFQVTNVFIEDIIPEGCNFITGSANMEPAVGNTLVWSIPTMDPGEETTITYLLKTDPAIKSVDVYKRQEDDLSEAAFVVMPNPASNMIQVAMTSLKENNGVVRIYDLTGHLLVSENWNITAGQNQKRISVSAFASGMYVIQVNTKDGMRSEKFVKE